MLRVTAKMGMLAMLWIATGLIVLLRAGCLCCLTFARSLCSSRTFVGCRGIWLEADRAQRFRGSLYWSLQFSVREIIIHSQAREPVRSKGAHRVLTESPPSHGPSARQMPGPIPVTEVRTGSPTGRKRPARQSLPHRVVPTVWYIGADRAGEEIVG